MLHAGHHGIESAASPVHRRCRPNKPVLYCAVQIAEEHNDIEHNDIVLFTLCASVICIACHAWQSLRIAIATSVQACTPVHARTSARLVVIYFHAEVARVKARGL